MGGLSTIMLDLNLGLREITTLRKFVGEKQKYQLPFEIQRLFFINDKLVRKQLIIDKDLISIFESKLLWRNDEYATKFMAALTNAGRNIITQYIVNSGSPTSFANANAYLGVGDSSTAFAAAQTDLQASSNKYRQAMESSYPTIATNVLTFRSLFATGNGNFAWAEWGVFNASSSGTMLSRKVESLGTKTSAQSWQLDAAITINNP